MEISFNVIVNYNVIIYLNGYSACVYVFLVSLCRFFR